MSLSNKQTEYLGSGPVSRAGISKEDAQCNGKFSKFENQEPGSCFRAAIYCPCDPDEDTGLHCCFTYKMKGWPSLWSQPQGGCEQEVSRPGSKPPHQRDKVCSELFHMQDCKISESDFIRRVSAAKMKCENH